MTFVEFVDEIVLDRIDRKHPKMTHFFAFMIYRFVPSSLRRSNKEKIKFVQLNIILLSNIGFGWFSVNMAV